MPHADHVIAQARRDIAAALARSSPSCRGRGCSWCCHQPVALHPAEASLLLRRVALPEPRPGPACPFLVDGACSIYADRPLACRMHAVMTPPEDCDTVSHPGKLVGRLAEPRRIYAAALVELGPGKAILLSDLVAPKATR